MGDEDDAVLFADGVDAEDAEHSLATVLQWHHDQRTVSALSSNTATQLQPWHRLKQ